MMTVANGCTIGRKKPPYGFTFSKPRPSASSRRHSCGPAYISNPNAPFEVTGWITVALALVCCFSDGCGSACITTPLNGATEVSANNETTKYLVLLATHDSGPLW